MGVSEWVSECKCEWESEWGSKGVSGSMIKRVDILQLQRWKFELKTPGQASHCKYTSELVAMIAAANKDKIFILFLR